jgi:hypothetical protein
VRECFEPPGRAFVADLGRRRPSYSPTASYGHFGRSDVVLAWERLDRVEDLRRSAQHRRSEGPYRRPSTPMTPNRAILPSEQVTNS